MEAAFVSLTAAAAIGLSFVVAERAPADPRNSKPNSFVMCSAASALVGKLQRYQRDQNPGVRMPSAPHRSRRLVRTSSSRR